jgi:hypothetical protein
MAVSNSQITQGALLTSVLCDGCGGRGVVEVRSPYQTRRQHRQRLHLISCALCNGIGHDIREEKSKVSYQVVLGT